MNTLGHLTSLPTGPFRFIAVDVETAGKTIAGICQIGLCFVSETGAQQTFSALVNPEGPFEPFNTNLHGIDAAMVADAPTFPQIYHRLFPVMNACHLVQHSTYDETAFTAACARYGLTMVSSHWTDSVKVARQAWPELKGAGGHGLGNLKQVLGLDFQHHDAGEDARASASVILLAEAKMNHRLGYLQSDRQLSFPFEF